MAATIFQKIIDHEIPADIIYEDDQVLCFLDINPVNKGHALIIPKTAFENVFDADEEVLAHMMRVSKKIATAIKDAVKADGVNLIMNNGAEAGQEVFHAHLHVVPRFKDDGSFMKPNHAAYGEGESGVLATQLRASLET